MISLFMLFIIQDIVRTINFVSTIRDNNCNKEINNEINGFSP